MRESHPTDWVDFIFRGNLANWKTDLKSSCEQQQTILNAYGCCTFLLSHTIARVVSAAAIKSDPLSCCDLVCAKERIWIIG
jgi:hypothetical protein